MAQRDLIRRIPIWVRVSGLTALILGGVVVGSMALGSSGLGGMGMGSMNHASGQPGGTPAITQPPATENMPSVGPSPTSPTVVLPHSPMAH